ncbi:solute carrier family 23 protein [Parabacteroides sp. AD58]|uniref:Solute carrier family 23 protein n=1 Tax=Parabacteroides absconsus TaxID=2951805 RepID=A0ABZ2ILD2_9BACT|nr:solute carrier family 23 protein [Parabacteroides sp. AD58]MCM6902300.1 NCS2 family nucleobase:cation symporter [Parabacteroides sp. AD58]
MNHTSDTTLTPIRKGIVGVQFLFVAFGATVLVPLLVGLDPSTALFTAGIGTLVFHLVSKGKVPIFLGSSFAFIAPIIKATELYGLSGTLFGLTGVGLVYFAMSALVKWQGLSVIHRIFPPVVIGPVIILIGITLAGTGVKMAEENWVLALISLATAVIVSLKAKGLLRLIPIFCGIGIGYLTALFFYEVDLSGVREASWFSLPEFVHPTFSWEAFVFMIPVAIAPVIEHIGNIYVVNTVANKDFVKDPGLHRTLLGDGIACMIAGVLGGPPVTTYAEVTGAMSITKVTNPQVIRIAAVTAILFSLIGKISALLKSIPNAVLGGIMLLIFGTIATAGVTNMLQHKVDLTNTRNIIIFSLTLTIGIGGANFTWGELSLSGIGLAAIVGVVLNLILPQEKEAKEEKQEQ